MKHEGRETSVDPEVGRDDVYLVTQRHKLGVASLAVSYPDANASFSACSLTCSVPPSWLGPGWTVPAGSI